MNPQKISCLSVRPPALGIRILTFLLSVRKHETKREKYRLGGWRNGTLVACYYAKVA